MARFSLLIFLSVFCFHMTFSSAQTHAQNYIVKKEFQNVKKDQDSRAQAAKAAAEQEKKTFVQKYFGWWPERDADQKSVFDKKQQKPQIIVTTKPKAEENTAQDAPKSFVGAMFAQLDPPETEEKMPSKEEFKALVKSTYGECEEQDLKMISLIDQSFDQYTNELNKHVQEGISNGRYKYLEDLDLATAEEEFAKTGQAPEEFKDMFREKPDEAMNILDVITQKEYMEKYAEAHLRCINVDELLKDENLQKLIAPTNDNR